MAERLELPESEFSYIGRPWETFTGRWDAIRTVLAEESTRNWGRDVGASDCGSFSLLDLGSNNGYFSLQAAHACPDATVIGVEGAVGVGNGTLGTATQDWTALCGTAAIRTHLRWIRKLGLRNCVIVPEVWDYQRIRELADSGCRVDVLLSLSVVHHIDNYSAEKIGLAEGEQRVPSTMAMLADLLRLAPLHVIELPDRPWLNHIHDAYDGPRAILEAVCSRAGGQWQMRKIYENAWIGHRELWLLRRDGPRPPAPPPVPLENTGDVAASWQHTFPVILPSQNPGFAEWLEQNAAAIDKEPTHTAIAGQPALTMLRQDQLELVGTRDCMASVLFGVWRNAAEELIHMQEGQDAASMQDAARPPCSARYPTRGTFPVWWRADACGSGAWTLRNHGGEFKLEAASRDVLVWARGGPDPFCTRWMRIKP